MSFCRIRALRPGAYEQLVSFLREWGVRMTEIPERQEVQISGYTDDSVINMLQQQRGIYGFEWRSHSVR